MIVEIKFIEKIGDFFTRMFQNKKEKRERDASHLKKAYDLLKELEETWDLPLSERRDLVDYTNLLLQNAQEIRLRKNKAIVRDIRAFSKRNCLAGVIPKSELERVYNETLELLGKMKESASDTDRQA
jgi:hypothetical protein